LKDSVILLFIELRVVDAHNVA